MNMYVIFMAIRYIYIMYMAMENEKVKNSRSHSYGRDGWSEKQKQSEAAEQT